MLPEGGTLRVQRKREKWVCPREINQQSESGAKMEENWHDNQPQIANVRMRGEGRKRKEPGQEKLEEWGNNRSKIHRSINQTTVTRSDAPQEEIERDMICNVMQMNRGTKTTARREDCKYKDPTKVIELYQNWLGTRGKGGGVYENKCSAMHCELRCYFSHSCSSLAYDYFNHRWFCKANEMDVLIVIFVPQC